MTGRASGIAVSRDRGKEASADRAARGQGLPNLSRAASAPAPGVLGLGEGLLLPSPDRRYFEHRLGADLSGVRLHPDAPAAHALGARAFAAGRDIGFAPGQFRPGTDNFRTVLGHELGHVLQQGATGPAVQLQEATPQPVATPISAGQGSARMGAGQPAPVAGPPILWGFDQTAQPRRYYVSVLPPARSLGAIAQYIYGSESAADSLRAANPGLGDTVAAGTTITLAAGTLSSDAQAQLNRSLHNGTVMHTDGIPAAGAPPPDAPLHNLTIGGQEYHLTDVQYSGLLHGLAWHLGLEADRYKGLSEVYLDTLRDHVENSNSVIRGISDWMGDVSVPDESIYTGPRDRAQAIIDELASEEPTEQQLIEASRRLRSVAQDYYAGEQAWHVYIEGTIGGAERTARGLEVVRNSCFAIEAGLAGAVVAPFAFAAAGGGALGVGAAVGGGAAAGGLLRGNLEVALPGMQADRPAGERFWSGAKSGAIQGGIGAAGALVAPAVSGALAPRLGITAEVAPTLGQRMLLGSSTGIVIGAPSGLLGAGLENFGHWYNGEISLTDYLLSMGGGAAGGAIGGGVFGALPIEGLYRSGGQPLNPFSGTPVMPRWMMAGPLSPLQASWNPPAEFNALPATQLPRLPTGYGWARINGVWEPICLTGPNRMPLTLARYGPNANQQTNYNMLSGDELVLSSAVTRPRGGTYPPGNRGAMPFDTADFTDPSGQQWIVGHNVDYADTIDLPNVPNSNADPLNYTPEPDWWGLHLRRNLVGRIRANNGSYRQMNFYSPTPVRTASGNPVPDGVIFVEVDAAGNVVQGYQIPFTPNGPTRLANIPPQWILAPNQIPAGILSPTPTPPIAGAGAAAGADAATQRRQ